MLGAPTRYCAGVRRTRREVAEVSSNFSELLLRRPDARRLRGVRRSFEGSGVEGRDLRSKRMGGAESRGSGLGMLSSGTEGLKRSWWTTTGFRVKDVCSATYSALSKYSLQMLFSLHQSDGGSWWPVSCSKSASGLNGASFCSLGVASTFSGNRNSNGYSIRPGGHVAVGVWILDNVFSWQKSSTSAQWGFAGLRSLEMRHVVLPMNLIVTRLICSRALT